MNVAVALLVLADLLLRGAAVPHAHAPDAADHDQSLRPHVHVTWHSHDEEHTHDHAAPADGHTVIYLDGAVMLFVTADPVAITHPVAVWLSVAIECPSVNRDEISAKAWADRPPGDQAATVHDLLPHVLRI